jgi:hypothetical protein
MTIRYIDRLLSVDVVPADLPKLPSAELQLQYIAELHKSEGWKMFRAMVESQLGAWEMTLIKGTGSAEKDMAARAAIHTAAQLLTWPERQANQLREWMAEVRNRPTP